MGRKIVFELTQPIYDADGELVGQPGDQISEAEYDKLGDTVTPGTYRAVIVEDEPKPKADAKADKAAEAKADKADAKAESKPSSSASSSFSSGKGSSD